MNTRLAALCFALICTLAALADDTSAKATKKTIRAADGVNIACEVRGQGDTALIFLHGWCGDHEYWKHQVEPFSADYRIVTLDQAGHGDSGKDRKKWTVDSLAADVETVVKQLGLKRVILVGHSMGGPVSLAAAKRMPGMVVAVIGVDTLQNADRKMPEEQSKQFVEMFEKDLPGTMKGMFPGMISEKADPELSKWLVTRAAAQDKTMAVALMRDMLPLDVAVLLKDAKVPVRCINSAGGYQFFTATATDINKKYADFNAVMIDDVGHYPMLEKPEEFNQKLKEVLKEFAAKK
jgi:pimeloyl-ACP methyl ester carboxylesterase